MQEKIVLTITVCFTKVDGITILDALSACVVVVWHISNLRKICEICIILEVN